jgi:hypothetical protein
MATPENPDRGEESSASDELRVLARSALSIFAVPPNEDQLFSPLTEVIVRVSKPFTEICLALRSNLTGLLSTVSMPYTMANTSAHDSHWQRIRTAAGIRSLMLAAKPDETKEALELRRESVALARAKPEMVDYVHSSEGRDALIRDTLGFLERLRSDESFAGAANELMLQGVVLCWGAFEVFGRDCFIAYLNAKPSRTLALLADPGSKRRFEVSKVSLETLAEHNFDLSGRMGTLLAKQHDLSDVYSVKSVYQALFPDSGKLSEALNDPDLRLLSLRRNLIVHQRGVIDETYKFSSKCIQHVRERLRLSPSDLEVHLGTTIRAAVSILDSVSTEK